MHAVFTMSNKYALLRYEAREYCNNNNFSSVQVKTPFTAPQNQPLVDGAYSVELVCQTLVFLITFNLQSKYVYLSRAGECDL